MAYSLVILGNKPLTLEVAKFVFYDPRFNLSGLIIGEVNPSSSSMKQLVRFANEHNIPCYSFGSIGFTFLEGTVGVSIGYPHILKKKEMEAFDKIINLHFGELPWYRGSGTVSHAILNGDTTFGMTLHRIDLGVDTGPIYRIERFPIRANALASDVIRHGELVGLRMVRESLAKICKGQVDEISQESLLSKDGRNPKQYFRRSLAALQVLDGLQSFESLARLYRAARLPGRPPPIIQFGPRRFAVTSLTELEFLVAKFA